MPVFKPIRGIRLNKSHPLARGLAGFWPLNEGTGKIVNDLSGNNIAGALIGDAKWVPGKFGSALGFDGDGDYVVLGNDNPLPLAGASATVIVLVVPSNLSVAVNETYTYGKVNNNQVVLRLNRITNDTIRAAWWNEAGDTTIAFVTLSAAGMTVNGWYQLVSVYKAGEAQLYVNGKLKAIDATPISGLIRSGGSISSWRLASEDAINQLDGKIGYAMIYRRALTAFEIAWLYRKPFCMFEPDLNIARISSIVAPGLVEIAGDLAALSFLTDSAPLRRTRGIAGGVAAQSSLAGSVKVSKKISGVINATSSLSGTLSLVGEVSRSRGSGFKPIEGAERLRGLRRSAFY